MFLKNECFVEKKYRCSIDCSVWCSYFCDRVLIHARAHKLDKLADKGVTHHDSTKIKLNAPRKLPHELTQHKINMHCLLVKD